MTAGVSWHNAMFHHRIDVESDPGSGFHPPTATIQFAAIGAEFNAWKWGTAARPVTVRIWPVTTAVHSRPGGGESHRLMWFTLMLQA
ncbi:putative plasmid transfer protein [Escherichia coli]|uniref:Putative plasmid transfer protein n=1 Tax=Escherichia coli TaxID=562 RepID=A0A376KJW5_ECOLX|nr:putative plasmid transfer protein [Escherichia coli]